MAQRPNEHLERRDALAVATRRDALKDVDQQFNIGNAVRHMQSMMHKVTEKDVSADTVNAACNCVSQVNSIMKTSIMAAKFIAGK